MVAVIKTGHSLRRILSYNENKVAKGHAVCIGESNYPMAVTQLNFGMKLNRLEKLAELNRNATRNSVHVSLNFSPSESGMEKEKLNAIARDYMQGIGFGTQPYLVYEHHDAGHPHLHIVSVKIRPDGKRIDMQNIGRNQSETTRRQLEIKYGLVAAQSTGKDKNLSDTIAAAKVVYGKTDSRKAVSNVLGKVLPSYRYASLAELNAVLRLYNVMADRGSEESRMFSRKGLVYRILDEGGKKVGVPLKASSIYTKPTLAWLEKRFGVNEIAKAPFKSRVKNAIDRVLIGKNDPSLQLFCNALEKEGISVALRQSDQGRLYGITYIDHRTQCVFNGSALGKTYSAKGILERTATGEQSNSKLGSEKEFQDISMGTADSPQATTDLLTRAENTSDFIPNGFKRKKKKKGHNGQR